MYVRLSFVQRKHIWLQIIILGMCLCLHSKHLFDLGGKWQAKFRKIVFKFCIQFRRVHKYTIQVKSNLFSFWKYSGNKPSIWSKGSVQPDLVHSKDSRSKPEAVLNNSWLEFIRSFAYTRKCKLFIRILPECFHCSPRFRLKLVNLINDRVWNNITNERTHTHQ